jgi:hypothetical protein
MLAMRAHVAGLRIAPCHTQVEALANGWLWAARRDSADSTTVTLFISPTILRRRPRGQHSACFLKMLQSSSLADSSNSLRVVSDFNLCDATPAARSPLADDGVFRVGDASLALDPLSGQGFQRALSSGVQAAIVLNTILARDKSAAFARDFYLDRHREGVREHTATCRAFYRRQDRFDTAFWRERALGEGSPEWPLLPHSLPPRVDEKLFIAPEVRWKNTPVIEGEFVECRPTLSYPSLRRPIAFLEGELVANLLHPFAEGCTGSAWLQSWSAHPGMPPAACTRALKFFLSHEILVADKTAAGIPFSWDPCGLFIALTTAGGGTRKDHSHVVIREKADGTKSAHAAPRKSKR